MRFLMTLLLVLGMLSTSVMAAEPSRVSTSSGIDLASLLQEWQDIFHDYGGRLLPWITISKEDVPALSASPVESAVNEADWQETLNDYGGDLSVWTTPSKVSEAQPTRTTDTCKAEWENDFDDYGGDISLWTDLCD